MIFRLDLASDSTLALREHLGVRSARPRHTPSLSYCWLILVLDLFLYLIRLDPTLWNFSGFPSCFLFAVDAFFRQRQPATYLHHTIALGLEYSVPRRLT